MKKHFTNFALFLTFSVAVLSSCNKADVQDQLSSTSDKSASGSAGNSKYGRCGCCPATVPTAIGMSYSLTFWDFDVHIVADVTYTNSDADGTFRAILKNASGDIDSVAIVPISLLNPNQFGLMHLEFVVPANGFPYTLHVHGRPLDLTCDTRTKKTFTIDNDVSRTK